MRDRHVEDGHLAGAIVVEAPEPRGARRMPEKPGTWLFHCHLTFQVTTNPAFGADSLPAREYSALLEPPHGNEHPEDHVVTGMGETYSRSVW